MFQTTNQHIYQQEANVMVFQCFSASVSWNDLVPYYDFKVFSVLFTQRKNSWAKTQLTALGLPNFWSIPTFVPLRFRHTKDPTDLAPCRTAVPMQSLPVSPPSAVRGGIWWNMGSRIPYNHQPTEVGKNDKTEHWNILKCLRSPANRNCTTLIFKQIGNI